MSIPQKVVMLKIAGITLINNVYVYVPMQYIKTCAEACHHYSAILRAARIHGVI